MSCTQTCLSGLTIATQPCAVIAAGQPYCIGDGICANQPTDSTCASTGNVCPASGSFPDPRDCSRYFTCTAPGGTATERSCATNQVYDASQKVCKRRIWATDCAVPQCAGRTGLIAHPTEPSLYVLCPGDGSSGGSGSNVPIVLQCDDPVNTEFSESAQTCVSKCTSVGFVADEEDCTAYYWCYAWGTRIVKQHQQCWQGWYFNRQWNTCWLGACPTTSRGAAEISNATLIEADEEVQTSTDEVEIEVE